MAWARLDDTFPSHRKVRRLSDGAFRLHVTAICYAAHDLTDGVIHADDLEEFRGVRRPERHVQALVDAGAWEVIADGVWKIHDYLDYNPSRTQVLAEREASRERQRRRRAERAERAERHAVSHAVTTGEVTEASHRESQHPDPSRPVPTRPDPSHVVLSVVGDQSPSSSSSLTYRAGGDR